ncbi:hypothetical protein [Trinickia dinghuensis]|uniref:Type VI secretion system lipoprotein TssJ n=1 Tax=Trinickia dinghuensis TaxID=2291023 RepID=A0A3D8JPI8_9BURK|nr:hypothetical protein [Trinickia dinghuensis]RDU94732.1 hypothetical protein DWV00_32535 [Trinickia dinghuensis]
MTAAYLLAACSWLGFSKHAAVSQIKVVAQVDADQNAATQLDIVFVYDNSVLGLLPSTGPDWFQKKDALISGLANDIDVVSLQVPPATVAGPTLPKRHGKAIAVYVYANYLSPAGQAKGNITPYKNVTIWLTATTIQYKPQ